MYDSSWSADVWVNRASHDSKSRRPENALSSSDSLILMSVDVKSGQKVSPCAEAGIDTAKDTSS